MTNLKTWRSGTRFCCLTSIMGLCALALVITGCPGGGLQVMIECPTDTQSIGQASTVTVMVSDGTADLAVAVTGGNLVQTGMSAQDMNGNGAAEPATVDFTVIPTEETVTVMVTATLGEMTDTAECSFMAEVVACSTDADCDDGQFCTGTETCVDNVCQAGAGACGADETCDESSDSCIPTCETDADCDDGIFCNGAEVCDDGTCASGTDPCAADEGCDEENDMCVAICSTDDDCDDGDPCNGSETCDPDDANANFAGCVAGTAQNCDDMDPCTDDSCDAADPDADADTGCVNTPVVCPDGMSCDPDTGDCIDACANAADCDDGDPCTDDACDAGICDNSPVDCDDGEFCTGTETCNPDTGDCESSGDPCGEMEMCNDEMDICDMLTACTEDADCDDGLFCNGSETCMIAMGETEGTCAAGTDPCADDETCDEANDECDAPAGRSFRLTLGSDLFNATNPTDMGTTSGDDTFDATREVSGGNLFQTLNNADNINARGGTDSINVQFQNGGTTTPANLAGLEVFDLEITDANNTTLNLLNADSVTTVNNNNSGADLTVMNIQTVPTNFGMTNTTQDTTFTVVGSGLSGGSDSTTLTVSGVTVNAGEPVVTVQPSSAGSGFESINLVSEGGVANNLDDLVDGNGTSFATLNVSGSQNVKIDDALNGSVTTVNGAEASGRIDVLLGANNSTVTGGSGNDTLRFGGNFNTNDTVNGGEGTDTLLSTQANFVGTTVAQTNVTNVETIRTSDALAGNLNVVHWGAQNATIAGKDGTARTVTVPEGGNVELRADAGANALTVALSGSDTTTNTFNLKLNGTATADMAGDLTATSFEILNLECTGVADGGSNNLQAITLNNTAAAESITVTGGISLDIDGAITADSVDASAFTGGFDNVGAAATGAISITSGSGTDSLRGSSGADILSAGDGNDRLQGDAGSDLLTGGSGNDTFDQDNIAQADTDTITDFDAGTSTSAVDIFIWDISSIEAFAAVTDLVDSSANSGAAGNNTFVQLGSDGQTVANADIVGLIGDYTNAADALANQANWTIVYGAALTDNDAYLVAYTSGTNVRIAVAVDNGGAANSDAVDTLVDIAILQNVSLSNLNSGDFNSE